MEKLKDINLPTFFTNYFLVYGTLRLGNGNYYNYGLDEAKHVGTYKLKGWMLSGLSGFPTGDTDDYLVVDLFDISELSERQQRNINVGIDGLEGVPWGYKSTKVSFKLDGEPIEAKLYLSTPYGNRPRYHSYMQRDEDGPYEMISDYKYQVYTGKEKEEFV